MIYSLDRTLIDALLERQHYQIVGDMRKRVILEWLNRFKFSNREVLSRVIDVQSSAKYRIIKNLIDKGYIEEIESNKHAGKLIKLTRKGLAYLISEESVSHDASLVNRTTVKSYSRVSHELGLQSAVLNIMQILYKEGFHRFEIMKEYRTKTLSVDVALRCYHEELGIPSSLVAIEYENSTKSRKRADYLIVQHYLNIKQGLFDQVHFSFGDERDLKTYASYIYEQPQNYKKDKKGKLWLDRKITLENEYLSKVHFGYFDVVGHYKSKPYLKLDYLEHAKKRAKNNAIKAKKEREKILENIKDDAYDDAYQEGYEQGYEDAKQELRSKIVNDIKHQTQKQTYLDILKAYDEMGMFKTGFRGILQEYIDHLEEQNDE